MQDLTVKKVRRAMPMTLKDLEYKLDNYYNHWALKDAINRLKSLEAEYKALYDTSGAINYDGMPHSTTPHEPPLDAVCRMEDKPEELQKVIIKQRLIILEINSTDEAIETALHRLEPPEEEIIHLRHMERMSWPDIGNVTHYTERWAREKYLRVLHKLLFCLNEKTAVKQSKTV
jgi:hypothetical protein